MECHSCNGRILHSQCSTVISQSVGRTLEGTTIGISLNGMVLTEQGSISCIVLVHGPDLVAQVEVNGILNHCNCMSQAGILIVVNEVFFNSSLQIIAYIGSIINLTSTIVKNDSSVGVILGFHVQRTEAVVVLLVVIFVDPVIGSSHGTGLHLVLLLNINTVCMHHAGHVQTVLAHLIHINVDRTILADHAAISSRVAAGVNIVPVSAVVIDLADSTGEPGILIAGVVVLGLITGLNLNIIGMGRIVVLVISRQIIRRNLIALAVSLYFVDIAVIQGVDIVNRLCPHLTHSLGRNQEIAVVNSAFALYTVLRNTFHINVVIAGIHIEPVADHLVVSIVRSRSILDLNSIEIVHIVECTAAEAFTSNGSLSRVSIEHNLVKVNNVAALGIDLSGSTPLAVLGVDLRECSLNQICIGCSICQTDTTVVTTVLHGAKLVAQQRTEGGHLDGVIITAGTSNIQHGTHVEHSIFSQPVMDHQHLMDIVGACRQSLNCSHCCIAHSQQFCTKEINIRHKCLRQHLNHLDHLCRRNLHIGIQVTQNLQSDHGVSLSVLGSPVVSGNAKILSVIGVECTEDRIVVRNLSRAVILGLGGIETNDLRLAGGRIDHGLTVRIHFHIRNRLTGSRINNGIAIRSNHNGERVIHESTDLHIGVQDVVFHSLTLAQSGLLALINSSSSASLNVDPNILSHGEVGKLIFFGVRIVYKFNILTAFSTEERDLGQLVVNICQGAFHNFSGRGIINQTTIEDCRSRILSNLSICINPVTGSIGTEDRIIVIIQCPLKGNLGFACCGDLILCNGIAKEDHVQNIDYAVLIDIAAVDFIFLFGNLITELDTVQNVNHSVSVSIAQQGQRNSMHGACSVGICVQKQRMTRDGITIVLQNCFSIGSNRDLHIQLGQLIFHCFHSGSITIGHIKANLGDLIILSSIPQILNCVIQIVLIEDLVHELGHIFLAQAILGNIDRTIGKFLFQVGCNGILDRIIGHFSCLLHTAYKCLVGLFLSMGDFHCTKLFDRIADQCFSTCKRVQCLCGNIAGLDRSQTGNVLRSGCGSRNGRCDCRQRQHKGYANR